MKNILITLLVSLSLAVGITSCLGTGEGAFGPETVFTTHDQVIAGGEFARVPVEQLPAKIQEALPEGKEVVMTTRGDLVEGGTYVPLGGELTEEGTEGIVKTIFGIGSAFIPGLAAWEGIAMLLSKRKRQNYARAVKQATPHGGKIDLADAAKSIPAALGLSHTSKNSEAAAEADIEAEKLPKV